jgi:hypothetical protein
MMRALKIGCTVNLVFAIALVAGYILYGLSAGVPIDECFLSAGRWHLGRGAGPIMPPWAFPALLDTVILTALIVGRYSKTSTAISRALSGVFGFVCLIGLLMPELPHRVIFPEDQTPSAAVPRYDYILTCYVWISHVAYGLIGTNDT